MFVAPSVSLLTILDSLAMWVDLGDRFPSKALHVSVAHPEHRQPEPATQERLTRLDQCAELHGHIALEGLNASGHVGQHEPQFAAATSSVIRPSTAKLPSCSRTMGGTSSTSCSS